MRQNSGMVVLSSAEQDILKCAFYDGALRVNNATIQAVRTGVPFSGPDYTRAFRSLRAQGFFTWLGNSPDGGQLYDLTESGKLEFSQQAKAR